jgi:hypothetical protein
VLDSETLQFDSPHLPSLTMLIPCMLNMPANSSVANITEILSTSTGITSRDSTPGTCSIRCRTSPQIFWSCASVLIACTWVSIHPNIPGPKDKWWRVLAEKISLMLVTLIAPEMMLYWACRDWYSARILAKSMSLISIRSCSLSSIIPYYTRT